jgi:hypothetical protein
VIGRVPGSASGLIGSGVAAVVTWVDHLRAPVLRDLPLDVDQGAVAVEHACGGGEAGRVGRQVQGREVTAAPRAVILGSQIL